LRRSRAITLVSLASLTALAWAYVIQGAGMDNMHAMSRPSVSLFAILTGMWWVMMVAMMVPSAAPAILLYGQVYRARTELAGRPPTGAFLAGYLASWLAFAVTASTTQLLLQKASIASPMTMALQSKTAAAGLLIAAGAYQLSPLKNACLGKCRAPASFLAAHYLPGRSGAFRMGLLHGAFCIGCCWMLTALLLVGGVMNIAWIAAITLIVAAEKILQVGHWIARFAGVAFIVWGTVLLTS
jgi:predicted metal-binding membrane protein